VAQSSRRSSNHRIYLKVNATFLGHPYPSTFYIVFAVDPRFIRIKNGIVLSDSNGSSISTLVSNDAFKTNAVRMYHNMLNFQLRERDLYIYTYNATSSFFQIWIALYT
jgi:hypothetical protein